MDEVKKLTPSSFRYIGQCPCWQKKPTPPTKAMARGTAMDSLLRNYLFHSMESLDGLSHKDLSRRDFAAVEWAGNTIRRACGENTILCKKADCKLKFSVNGVLISGEMDACCPTAKIIFDLKSGRVRDYELQMLPYALYATQAWNVNEVDTSLVFCDFKLEQRKKFTASEANERMEEFVDKWIDPNKVPVRCHACEFCIHYNKDKCSLSM